MGLIRYTFFSEVLREQTNISVVVPTYGRNGKVEKREDFYYVQKEGQREKKKLKTLYVLHGGSDDCTFYVRNTGIERYAQEGGFAAVFPEVKNSFYCNMKKGADYFDYISKELPAVVQSVFPLSEKREDHYVVGNSMGSHGSIKWALNCPEFFAAAAGMSGVGDVEELGFFDVEAEGLRRNVYQAFGTVEDYKGSQNDLKDVAKQMMLQGTSMPRLFSCCGRQDPYYEGARKFAEYAASIGLPLTWEEGEGAHTWEFWDRWLVRIIDWMGIAE